MTAFSLTTPRGGHAAKVVAGVVAGLLLVGLGLALGRADRPAATPNAAPQADGATSTTETGPGPSTTTAGVPTGYAQSRDGAVAAAANLAVVLDSPMILDPQRREEVLEVVAAQDATEQLDARFRDMATLLEERMDLGPADLDSRELAMRTVPAGYQVLDHTQDTATVAVWGTSLFVASGRQVGTPQWGTTEVELVWERDDWRVADVATVDGPAPVASADSSSAASTAREINGFAPFVVAPGQEG